MSEFKSELEEIIPAEELDFEATSGFGRWRNLFYNESITHPAKANLRLIDFLIKKYTKEGDTILDPMAGTYSTCVLASILGRNGVGVELEEKFYKWGLETKKIVESTPSLTSKGNMIVLKGDARRLTEILNQACNGYVENKKNERVDSIIVSPPYAATISKVGGGCKIVNIGVSAKTAREYSSNPENIGNLPVGDVDAIITSPPYVNIARSNEGGISPHMQGLISKLSGIPVKEFANNVEKLREAVKIAQSKIPFKYSDNQENIGNLPVGNVDAIITSPPYVDSNFRTPERLNGVKSLRIKSLPGGYLKSKDNIENLSMGNVDAIITSPPYEGSVSDNKEGPLVGGNEKKYGRWKNGTAKKNSYTQHNEPCKIDTIITSPPYADSKKHGEVKPEEVEKYAKRWEENAEKYNWNSWGKNFHTPGRLKGIESLRDGYSKSKDNIGNLPVGNVDAIITSPPYESSLEGTSRHTRGGIASRDPNLAQTGTYATTLSFGVPVGYSPDGDNIGNLKSKDEEYEQLDETIKRLREYGRTDPKAGGPYGKSLAHPYSDNPQNIGNLQSSEEEYQLLEEKLKSGKSGTYLSEMLKVYREMYNVLKSGGYAIVIVKPFQRNYKIIDLPLYTYKLLSLCGFALEKLYKLRLKTQSFWRILLLKKHPELPKIAHEYVLVCRKS